MTRATTGRRRLVRGARLLAVLVAAGAFLPGSGPAAAQEEPAASLGGFTGRAAASGLAVRYDPVGLLPIPSPVDISAPDALATIASGPATFARASVLDPGELLANPDALIQQASPGYVAGQVPPYPFRISATSAAGEPSATSNAAPGFTARVDAADTASRAESRFPGTEAPAIATIGTTSAVATTETDGASVTVRARSELSGLDVLGLIKVRSVVTEVRAHTDGGPPTFEGGTTIVGAEVLGTPVTIDRDGIHLEGNGSGSLLSALVAPLQGGLNQLLQQVGLRITVAGPVELAGTTEGQLAAAGLRIDLEVSEKTVPFLSALVGALPPIDSPIPGAPGIEDVLRVVTVQHLASIDVGRGFVALSARGAGSFADAPAGDLATDLPAAGGGTVDVGSPTAPALGGPARPTGSPVTPATEPVAATQAGIGALVLLALLAQPLLGDRVAKVASAVLADRTSTSCTPEGP